MRVLPSFTRLVGAVVFACLGFMSAAPAFAQDDFSGLSGEESGWVGAPPAEDCKVEAATVDSVVGPMTTPDAFDPEAFPFTIATEDELPSGEPADDESVEAASAVVWAAVACLNAGDFGKFFALMSPDGVRSFYFGIAIMLGGDPGEPTEEDIAEMREGLTNILSAVPTPAAGPDMVRIDGIRDARTLPSGQLLVVVDGAIGEISTLYLVLNEDDEHWSIDAFGLIGDIDMEFTL